ncbi:MAG TPA: S53 family peptidase [Streptosporangiaceae bacterium]|nr:S53 family peptidase [Streptosporangiaceae bacterium]
MRLYPALPVAAVCVLTVAVGGAAGGRTAGLSTAGLSTAGGADRPAARVTAPVVLIAPDAVHAAGPSSQPPTTAFCEQSYHIACYSPRQIRQAYQLPALLGRGITGAGQTIVIVDSFGSPTVRQDLRAFDTAFGFPAPPALTVIQPAGPVPAYRPTANRVGWAGETDLDVEYAHAMAPGAKILLVETPTSENEGTTGFPQIVKAEEYVIGHHLGGVISQSFSATELTFPSRASLLRLRGAYLEAARHGVTVLAAAGDGGAADLKFNQVSYYLQPVTSWPDSDPLVTGVGGTQLRLDAAGRRTAPDQVWNDTYNAAANMFISGDRGPNPLAGGGGKSVMFARPGYQDSVQAAVGGRRGVPDISMSAACSGSVVVYQSFGGQPPGWYPTCGTSEATPLFAGIVALAGQLAGHPLGLINPRLYQLGLQHAPGIVDITGGSNTVSFRQGGQLRRVPGFTAGPGYDLASGLGTVDAAQLVPELAGATAAGPIVAGSRCVHHPELTPNVVS